MQTDTLYSCKKPVHEQKAGVSNWITMLMRFNFCQMKCILGCKNGPKYSPPPCAAKAGTTRDLQYATHAYNGIRIRGLQNLLGHMFLESGLNP